MFWLWLTVVAVLGMWAGYALRREVEVGSAYNRGHDEGFALAEKQEEQRRSRAGTKAAATRKRRADAMPRTAGVFPNAGTNGFGQPTGTNPLPLDHPQRLPVGRDD